MPNLSSRALAKLITVLAPRRCLPNSTRTCLWPSYRPVTASAMRFLSYPSDKSPKPYIFKVIGKTNCFEIGSIKITLSVQEFLDDKSKMLSISETDIRYTNKYLRHIWLSIPAAQKLLEKVELSKTIDRNTKDWLANVRSLSQFLDEERNHSIELKLVDHGLVGHGDKYLQIYSRDLDKPKRQSIFIPLDEITEFQEKLSNILQQYKKRSDPNKRSTSEDLYLHRIINKSWNDLNIGEALVQVGEFNKETGKKRSVYVPIAAVQTLFGLLEDGYKTIQRYEGFLPSGMQPLNILYEKSFMYKDHEYTVRVQVPKAQQRHLWDTILMIWKRNLYNSLKNNIMIGGRGAHLLLQHYEEILREYDYLNPYLTEADSSKPYEPIEELKKRTFIQKINMPEIETEPKIAELKKWKGSEENNRIEIAEIGWKFSKKQK